jgi:glycosyltransferase involved in cell wall biosynthesis
MRTWGDRTKNMRGDDKPVRVLYSFAPKLDGQRIGYTAWQQIIGLSTAGVEVVACPGVLQVPVPMNVSVRPTLSRGRLRISYKLVGRLRSYSLHDRIVARRLKDLAGQIDIVHTWPLGALETLRTARRMGVATVLERPNAHTRFAYEVVQKECHRIGVPLPPGHEHAYNTAVLKREEVEYELADRLLCPSDFVVQTFLERGFSRDKLVRHSYGFDEKRFYPDGTRNPTNGLNVLFAGVCAVRKGLHFALEAWLNSPAHHNGFFSIAGGFIPGYAEKLARMMAHPSVRVLGYRSDMPELMRQSDVLVLPTIEEGSALVTAEARGSGCVLVVSDAAGANCKHMENALVHRAGDVEILTQHLTMLHEDRTLLERLRASSLCSAKEITWTAAGVRLLEVYRKIIATKHA